MTTGKIVRIHNGHAEFTLPYEDLAGYLGSLNPEVRQGIKILGTYEDNGMDAVTADRNGKLHRAKMSPEQVKMRMDLGENPLVSGGDDPKLQAYNRQEQERIRQETGGAELYSALRGAAWTSWVGLHQKLEDIAIGDPEEAEHYRKTLMSDDPLVSTLSTGVSAAMLGGFGLGAAASALGLTGRALMAAKGAGALLGSETLLYQRELLDSGNQWSGEEYAGRLMQSMLIGGAFMGAGAVMKAGRVVVGRGGGAALSKLADATMFAGAAKHSKFLFNTSTKIRAVSRLLRGAGGKAGKVPVGKRTMEKIVKEGERSAKSIDNFRVGATSAKLRDSLDDISAYSGVPKAELHKIDFDAMNSGVRDVSKAYDDGVRAAEGLYTKMRAGGATAAMEGNFLAARDVLVSQMDDLGYGAVTSHLKGANTIGDFAEARLQALLSPHVGGSAEAAAHLKNFIDEAGFGSAWKQSGKEVNEAVERIAAARHKLKNFDSYKDFRQITGKDGTSGASLNKVAKELQELREGYAILEANKVLSGAARKSADTVIRRAEEKLLSGQKAYADAAKVNKLRETAAARHNEAFEAYKNNLASDAVEEGIEAAAGKFADRMAGLSGKLAKGMDAARDTAMLTGVLVRNVDYQEKLGIYKEARENINKLISAPEAMQRHLADIDLPNPEAGLKAAQGIYHLYGTLNQGRSDIYGRDADPSYRDVEVFFERYATIADPMSVAEATLMGAPITPVMVDTLRNVFPAQYAEMGAEVSRIIDEQDFESLPRPVRINVDKFLGGIDPIYAPQNLARLGMDYSQTTEQHQAGGVPIAPPQSPHQNNHFTATQKISAY